MLDAADLALLEIRDDLTETERLLIAEIRALQEAHQNEVADLVAEIDQLECALSEYDDE